MVHVVPTGLLTRQFVLLCTVGFVVIGGFFSIFPLLPGYVESEMGGGKIAVGVTVGIFALSSILVRPFVNKVGDTRGRRILIVVGTAVVAVALAGHTLAPGLPSLLLVRLVAGAGQAAFFVGSATMVNDLAPPNERARATNYFSVAVYLGQIAGGFLGEAVEALVSVKGSFVAAGIMAGTGTVLALFLPVDRPAPSSEPVPEVSWGTRLLHPRAVPPGLVLLVGTMTFVALTGFVPLYTDSLGISYAPILALYGVVIILVRGLGASLPDRLGRMRTASASIIAISAGMGIMAVWGTAAGLYVGVFVWALGISMLYPTLMVSAIEGVPDRERATVTGSFTMFFEVSGGIGGPVLGVAAALGGNQAAFATASVVAASGLFMLHAWTSRLPAMAAAPIAPTTP